MTNRLIRSPLLAAALLLPTAYVGSASAHDQLGQLGASRSATDIWKVICSGGSDYLQMQVKDALPKAGPKVSVLVFKGTIAANTTDAKDGNDAYSPIIRVNGGDGDYMAFVNKTGKAAENYLLEYHCESNSGGHTATTILQLQNQ